MSGGYQRIGWRRWGYGRRGGSGTVGRTEDPLCDPKGPAPRGDEIHLFCPGQVLCGPVFQRPGPGPRPQPAPPAGGDHWKIQPHPLRGAGRRAGRQRGHGRLLCGKILLAHGHCGAAGVRHRLPGLSVQLLFLRQRLLRPGAERGPAGEG